MKHLWHWKRSLSAAAKPAAWSLIPFVGLMLALSGCDDAASDGGCAQNQDCPVPEICTDGACVLECRIDDDCTRGRRCVESRCQSDAIGRDAAVGGSGGQVGGAGGQSGGAGGGVGMACRRNAECPLPLICIDEECALECRIDRDCEGDQRCEDNLCVEGGAGGGGGQVGGSGGQVGGSGGQVGGSGGQVGGAGGQAGGAGGQVGGAGGEAGGAGGQMMGEGQYGERCNAASDCQTGYCVENKVTGQRQCTQECANANTCPGTDLCIGAQSPQGGVVNVCFPNDTGLPCGRAQDACVGGICLTVPGTAELNWLNPSPVCSTPCENDFKCPQGFRCLPAATGGGGMQDVCVPNVDLRVCPQGNAAACQGVCPNAGPNDPLCVNSAADGNSNGFCSCTCQSAQDCPRGYACQDFGEQRACLPVAGYNCYLPGDQGTLQCLSGTCLRDDERPDLSYCTAFCNAPQDCPADYDCVGVPDGAGGVANICQKND